MVVDIGEVGPRRMASASYRVAQYIIQINTNTNKNAYYTKYSESPCIIQWPLHQEVEADDADNGAASKSRMIWAPGAACEQPPNA